MKAIILKLCGYVCCAVGFGHAYGLNMFTPRFWPWTFLAWIGLALYCVGYESAMEAA